jgi:hypothetical protein
LSVLSSWSEYNSGALIATDVWFVDVFKQPEPDGVLSTAGVNEAAANVIQQLPVEGIKGCADKNLVKLCWRYIYFLTEVKRKCILKPVDDKINQVLFF